MYPSQHLALGIIFSIILLFFFPKIALIGFLLIILSTFFVDVDHYLYYVYKKRDWSLKNAYNYYIKIVKKLKKTPRKERCRYKCDVIIFHGIEFWIILALLSLIHIFFFYIFIGVMFHMFLDFLALIYYGQPLYTKLSQVYNWKKNKNKKNWF